MTYDGKFRTRMLEETSSLKHSFLSKNIPLFNKIGKQIKKFHNNHQKLKLTSQLLYSCKKLVKDVLIEIMQEVWEDMEDFDKNVQMISELDIFGSKNNIAIVLIDSIKRISDLFNHELSNPQEFDYESCACMTLSFLRIVLNSHIIRQRPKDSDWLCECCEFNNPKNSSICGVCENDKPPVHVSGSDSDSD